MSAARSQTVALGISGALALVYLVWAPQTLDLAAQTFRAELWESDGFVFWSPDWYSGFSVPGYSLLYPPLGALLGPVLLGALCAVISTALFATVAFRAFGERAWLGVVLFGLASVAAPFAGRTTFALGLTLGLACMLAVQARRPALAAAAGLLTACASPVAGLFAALACAALILGRAGCRTAAWAGAVGAALGVAVPAIIFTTPGWQPFAFSAWIWIPIATAAVILPARRWLEPGTARFVLIWGAVLYLLVGTAALIVDTPLGGNSVRLGATLAAPIAAILLVAPERPFRPQSLLLTALVLVPLLWWQWTATVRDVAAATGEPAVEAAYFDPLLEAVALEAEPLEPLRVSPTRDRWEAVHVAGERPITGGWLRQLEADDFGFLDAEQIEPDAYRAWLAERGVGLVAVSDAEPDWLAAAEQDLFRSGAFDEELVAEAGAWQLYRFEPGSQVLHGEAEVVELEADSFAVELDDGGGALLGLTYSPYFEVAEGVGCVERAAAPGGRDITRISGAGEGPQRIHVAARFSLAGAAGRDRDCAG